MQRIKDYIIEYLPLQLEVLHAEATDLFNESPKKAFQYLIKNKVCEGEPVDIANFIFSHQKLSKRLIGDYVGGHDAFNQRVAEALFNMFPFAGLTLDEGIRYFVKRIRLPGEAQKIDRIMEKFAQSYHQQNPRSAASADTIFVLSFSIIMLNTDLHNPAIHRSKKMTLSKFIHNNRGMDNNRDFPVRVLTNIYFNIKKNPLKMNEEDMFESVHTNISFLGPAKAGWLEKRSSGILGRVLRRWFVLKDSCLYYFSSSQEQRPRCIIPLDGIVVTRVNSKEILLAGRTGDKRIKAGKLQRGGFFGRGTGGSIKHGSRSCLVLRAENEGECYDWYVHLRAESEPIHLILQQSAAPPDTSSSHSGFNSVSSSDNSIMSCKTITRTIQQQYHQQHQPQQSLLKTMNGAKLSALSSPRCQLYNYITVGLDAALSSSALVITSATANESESYTSSQSNGSALIIPNPAVNLNSVFDNSISETGGEYGNAVADTTNADTANADTANADTANVLNDSLNPLTPRTTSSVLDFSIYEPEASLNDNFSFSGHSAMEKNNFRGPTSPTNKTRIKQKNGSSSTSATASASDKSFFLPQFYLHRKKEDLKNENNSTIRNSSSHGAAVDEIPPPTTPIKFVSVKSVSSGGFAPSLFYRSRSEISGEDGASVDHNVLQARKNIVEEIAEASGVHNASGGILHDSSVVNPYINTRHSPPKKETFAATTAPLPLVSRETALSTPLSVKGKSSNTENRKSGKFTMTKNSDKLVLYLEGRAKLLQKNYSRNQVHSNSSNISVELLYIQINSSIKEGYLYVRDCSVKYKYNHPDIWIRKYCVLCDSFDKFGPTLFYFPTRERALWMKQHMVQTQQRYIRVLVTDVLSVTHFGTTDESSCGDVLTNDKPNASSSMNVGVTSGQNNHGKGTSADAPQYTTSIIGIETVDLEENNTRPRKSAQFSLTVDRTQLDQPLILPYDNSSLINSKDLIISVNYGTIGNNLKTTAAVSRSLEQNIPILNTVGLIAEASDSLKSSPHTPHSTRSIDNGQNKSPSRSSPSRASSRLLQVNERFAILSTEVCNMVKSISNKSLLPAAATNSSTKLNGNSIRIEEQWWSKVAVTFDKSNTNVNIPPTCMWRNFISTANIDRQVYILLEDPNETIDDDEGYWFTSCSVNATNDASSSSSSVVNFDSVAVDNVANTAPLSPNSRTVNCHYQLRLKGQEGNMPFDVYFTHEDVQELQQWVEVCKEKCIDSHISNYKT